MRNALKGFFLSFSRRGRTFARQIKGKERSQSLFCSSLGWRDKPRQSGPISGCQRRVSGTRRRQAAKPGEPTKERIGSCDVVGFGCLGRAIGATYGASSGWHSDCELKYVVSVEKRQSKQRRTLKKKVQFLLVTHKHAQQKQGCCVTGDTIKGFITNKVVNHG